MPSPDRIEALRSLLSREGWATVLVLAGASLLVAPPDRAGLPLVGWVAAALVTAFVVVLVGSRVGSMRRG